jgi:hypothetical protein
MANDPDGGNADKPAGEERRRPAPTIDLTATDVTGPQTPEQTPEQTQSAHGEQAAHDDAPPASPNRKPSSRKAWPAALGGAVAAACLILLGGFAATSFFPGRNNAPDARALDPLTARIAKIETALNAPRNADAALAGRIEAMEKAAKAASDAGAEIRRRLDEAAALSRDALARADAAHDAAQAASEAAVKAAQAKAAAPDIARSDIDALDRRVVGLEQNLKNLQADVAANAASAAAQANAAMEDRAGRVAIVSLLLLNAVERGAPFAEELAAVRALVPDAANLDAIGFAALQSFAGEGLPDAALLSREILAVTPMMRKAVPHETATESNVLERLKASAQNLVRIRPLGETGDAPVDVIARIEVKAARGDISGVQDELGKLPPDLRAAAASFIARVDARKAALGAARQFATGSLAALGKPKT